MSRAVRKAQRQRIDAIGDSELARGLSSDETDDASSVVANKPFNPFDLLDATEDVPADTSESVDAADRSGSDDSSTSVQLESVKHSQEKKGKKKKKSRANKKKTTGARHVDSGPSEAVEADFDSVLAAHRDALKDLPTNKSETAPFNLSQMLAIDIKMLDPNAEMRRLFGSRVVSSEREERISMNKRNLPRGMQQPIQRGRKSILVPVEDNYPLTIKGGLEMSMIEDMDGVRTFKFVHSKAYQQTQMMFRSCVQSGDPQTLMNLLSRAPFHVDTLLQVSEIMRHQGDNEQSADMLSRALFAFDRAFHPLFNIASGAVRLPFEYPENRPFYLAIYRYIQALGRQGCWTTAFEFNKLLYALAPEEDPYAALLSIDFYAIKARRWDFIQKLNDCPWNQVLDDNFPKPNFSYAKAVANFLSLAKGEDSTNANSDMEVAIRQFPFFMSPLFNELKATGPIQYDNLEPESAFGCLVRDLYVFRAKDIYNTPELTKFLRESALPVEKFDPATFAMEIPVNVCRHILLLDERTLLHYLPRSITQNSGLSFDPLPPADSLPSYMDSFMTSENPASGISTSFVPQFIQNILRRMIPDATNAQGEIDRDLSDEEIARLLEQVQFAEDEAENPFNDQQERAGMDDLQDRNFEDPNGYGPNRGLDEPDVEGNAGRR